MSSLASADARIEARFAGGLEGGMITEAPHPSALAEVGLAAEWVSPRGLGVGVVVETVGRAGVELAIYEETKLDLMLRWARKSHRGGVGAGMRFMQVAPHDGATQPLAWGIDFVRLETATTFARIPYRDMSVRVDGYIAWTFGCYLGHTGGMAERPQLVREVRCGDTMTTAYVVGLQLALGTR